MNKFPFVRQNTQGNFYSHILGAVGHLIGADHSQTPVAPSPAPDYSPEIDPTTESTKEQIFPTESNDQ